MAFYGERSLLLQVPLCTACQPFKDILVFFRDTVKDTVYALLHKCLPVKLDLISGELPYLTGERPQGLLEKPVYCGNRKGRIIMEYARELHLGTFLKKSPVISKCFRQLIHIRRFIRFPGQSIKLLENPLLHFIGGLVGESHGQDMPVRIRRTAAHDKPDILFCKIVCFAGPRRRLQNLQHIHKDNN